MLDVKTLPSLEKIKYLVGPSWSEVVWSWQRGVVGLRLDAPGNGASL